MVWNLGPLKLVNCNQILDHVADQDYIKFIDKMYQLRNFFSLSEDFKAKRDLMPKVTVQRHL